MTAFCRLHADVVVFLFFLFHSGGTSQPWGHDVGLSPSIHLLYLSLHATNPALSLEHNKAAGEFFKGSISHKHTETKLIHISRSTNSDGETEKEAKVV